MSLGEIAGPKEGMNSTRRPTESMNMDPWGLLKTEPPTKEHTLAKWRLLAQI